MDIFVDFLILWCLDLGNFELLPYQLSIQSNICHLKLLYFLVSSLIWVGMLQDVWWRYLILFLFVTLKPKIVKIDIFNLYLTTANYQSWYSNAEVCVEYTKYLTVHCVQNPAIVGLSNWIQFVVFVVLGVRLVVMLNMLL